MDYRKAYAGKEVKYPANLQTMMDVMRQQPLKKKKKDSPTKKSPEKEKDKEEGASSFATTKGGEKRTTRKMMRRKTMTTIVFAAEVISAGSIGALRIRNYPLLSDLIRNMQQNTIIRRCPQRILQKS